MADNRHKDQVVGTQKMVDSRLAADKHQDPEEDTRSQAVDTQLPAADNPLSCQQVADNLGPARHIPHWTVEGSPAADSRHHTAAAQRRDPVVAALLAVPADCRNGMGRVAVEAGGHHRSMP